MNDRLPNHRVVVIMMKDIATVNNVSGKLRTTMLVSVNMIVMTDENSCGSVLIMCLNESMSFVNTDMMSPCARLSKYFKGRNCMCLKVSSRSLFNVPWLTLIISRL